MLAFGWRTTLKRAVAMIIWQTFDFDARNHIFGTAETSVAKYCVQVE